MSDHSMTYTQDFSPAAKDGSLQKLTRPSLSYWQDAWIRLKKNKQALASLFLILFLLAFVLIGPLVYRVEPSAQDLGRVSEGPNLGQIVTVIEDPVAYEELSDESLPATPDTTATEPLPAPQDFKLVAAPSTLGVQLSWKAVPGADSYLIVRSERAPADGDYGIQVADITGGNRINYNDTFQIVPGKYWYSVAAKVGTDVTPTQYSTIEVSIAPTMVYSVAQTIDPNAQVGQELKLAAHPLGTDYLGRDMLARLMSGGGVSLGIGFFAPFFSTLIGVFMGGIAGFIGGRVDAWLMRFTDFVLALPFLLFVILFKIALGSAGAGDSGIMAMMIALVALSWTSTARLTRGQILQLRETEFVQASKLLGAKPLYLLVRHLLPNTLGVILVSLTFEIPRAIFTEAFLSFIGMGVRPPETSWGAMCDDGVKTFLQHPHEFFFPALIISITVLAFNLLGDGLRDALDPRMRSVQ